MREGSRGFERRGRGDVASPWLSISMKVTLATSVIAPQTTDGEGLVRAVTKSFTPSLSLASTGNYYLDVASWTRFRESLRPQMFPWKFGESHRV